MSEHPSDAVLQTCGEQDNEYAQGRKHDVARRGQIPVLGDEKSREECEREDAADEHERVEPAREPSSDGGGREIGITRVRDPDALRRPRNDALPTPQLGTDVLPDESLPEGFTGGAGPRSWFRIRHW